MSQTTFAPGSLAVFELEELHDRELSCELILRSTGAPCGRAPVQWRVVCPACRDARLWCAHCKGVWDALYEGETRIVHAPCGQRVTPVFQPL